MGILNGWIQTSCNTSNLMIVMYSLTKINSQDAKHQEVIQVHTIFDVKVDGRHKSRVVVDGHLTATPSESVYSGVVSLRGLRTCVLIGEIYGMVPWAIALRKESSDTSASSSITRSDSALTSQIIPMYQVSRIMIGSIQFIESMKKIFQLMPHCH